MNINLPKKILAWFHEREKSRLPVYLVGGAIRDYLQGVETFDYDFIIQSGAIELARQLADDIKASFYIMDKERGIARIIFPDKGKSITLDFADFRGESLEEDLEHRDFTVNAIALEVNNPQILIDPLYGNEDFRLKIIRACSPDAFLQDPVRCLRAVRFSCQLGFRIEENTLSRLQASIADLPCSSIERQRDELFNILSLQNPRPAIQRSMELGILEKLLPELIPLVNYSQSTHHVHDGWMHTLAVMDYCRQFVDWACLKEVGQESNFYLMSALETLQPYRNFLKTYFENSNFEMRTLRTLFLFAALYHDVGKPATRSETAAGIQFVDHEKIGANLAAARAKKLALSNREVNFIEAVIRNHMSIHDLVKQSLLNLRQAAYKFFHSAGYAGVADCLFSLADLLATYEDKIDLSRWNSGLKMSCNLLDMWVNHYHDVINPILFYNGEEIKEVFQLTEGPIIGRLLNELKFAQAIGKIQNKAEAHLFLQAELNLMKGNNVS